jgi:hypothetical protein
MNLVVGGWTPSAILTGLAKPFWRVTVGGLVMGLGMFAGVWPEAAAAQPISATEGKPIPVRLRR